LPSSYSAANVTLLIADINAANQAGGVNTITLTAAPSSPYVLTTVNNTTDGSSGLPVISGKNRTHPDNLTIIGNGDTIERSSGPNTPSFRLLAVASGNSLTLENLTLTGGDAVVGGNYASPIGGGAVCNLGTLVLDAVTVTGNVIRGIPGYPLDGGTWPSSAAVGGGVWSSGSLSVQDGTVFENNVALGAAGLMGEIASSAMGGAIYVAAGSATISNTTITNNQAVAQGYPGTSGGGGIYIASGAVSIDAATVANTINNTDQSGLNGSTANIDGPYV
jgi:hypothetical protein